VQQSQPQRHREEKGREKEKEEEEKRENKGRRGLARFFFVSLVFSSFFSVSSAALWFQTLP
jgi:hypothetical protein